MLLRSNLPAVLPDTARDLLGDLTEEAANDEVPEDALGLEFGGVSDADSGLGC